MPSSARQRCPASQLLPWQGRQARGPAPAGESRVVGARAGGASCTPYVLWPGSTLKQASQCPCSNLLAPGSPCLQHMCAAKQPRRAIFLERARSQRPAVGWLCDAPHAPHVCSLQPPASHLTGCLKAGLSASAMTWLALVVYSGPPK